MPTWKKLAPVAQTPQQAAGFLGVSERRALVRVWPNPRRRDGMTQKIRIHCAGRGLRGRKLEVVASEALEE